MDENLKENLEKIIAQSQIPLSLDFLASPLAYFHRFRK